MSLQNVLQDANEQSEQAATPDNSQANAQAAPPDAQAAPDNSQAAQPQPQSAPDDTQAPDPNQVTPPSNLSQTLSSIPSMAADDMPRFQRTVGSTLKGMLVGLVSGGLRGAVAGGVSPTGIQRAATQEQAIQQSKVQFASAQAAHMVAQAAMEDKQLQSYDEDHRLDVTKANLGIVDELTRMGLKPVATTTMNQGTQANTQSAMNNLQNLTNTMGAVPPLLTLHVGDQSVSYDLNQLSRAPAGLDQVNKVRQIKGLPQYDDKTWSALAGTPQGIAETADAFKFDAPLPTQDNLTSYSNYLANLKNQPSYADKDADVAKLQSTVATMTKTLDEQNTRAAQQAGAAKGIEAQAAQPGINAAQVSNINATAKPEANAEALKAGAVAKAKAQFDDSNVVAFDPNYQNLDGTKGANVLMTRGQASENGLAHYKVDPSVVNANVAGMNDVQTKINMLAQVANDPTRMSQVQGPLAAALLAHGKGIEIGAFGTKMDTSRVNEALYKEDLSNANQSTRDYVAAMGAAHEAITQLPRLQTFGKSSRMTQQQMEAAQNMLPQPGDDAGMAQQKMVALQTTINPLRKQLPHMQGAEQVPSWMEQKPTQQTAPPVAAPQASTGTGQYRGKVYDPATGSLKDVQ